MLHRHAEDAPIGTGRLRPERIDGGLADDGGIQPGRAAHLLQFLQREAGGFLPRFVLALSGDLPALPVLAGETTILVDSTIGRWDIETLDVIDIALREG